VSRGASIAYWMIRVLLGVLIFGAGLGKALDVGGFVEVMRSYDLALPEGLYWPGAYATILFELVLGAWVLAGWRLTIAGALAVLMHSGYLLLLSSALWRGLELDNCGCFGVFLARPLRWYSPIEDFALIVVSFVLVVLAERRSA